MTTDLTKTSSGKGDKASPTAKINRLKLSQNAQVMTWIERKMLPLVFRDKRKWAAIGEIASTASRDLGFRVTTANLKTALKATFDLTPANLKTAKATFDL